MLNADEVHFVAVKKKSQFKLRARVGPFICNTRVAGEEGDKLVKEMKFGLSFTWCYDLMGIVSKPGVENKFIAYHHIARPEIEKYKNQLEWTKNTLQEGEEQVVSTSMCKLHLQKKRRQ